jgi:aryl-alcohol dehydrogenase-like predicted oxidoreductase
MLPEISRLTLGTGSVTTPGAPGQIRCIRRAMEAGIWMHCANYGNGVFPNLKRAFTEAPDQVPRTIFKVDGTSADAFRATLRTCLSGVGLKRMDIAQVCGFPVAEDPEAVLEAMDEARAEGLAGHFIMDLIQAWSGAALQCLAAGVFEGYIFYYNVTECEISQAFLDRSEQQGVPLFAMRTFGRGALLDPTRRPPYLEALYRMSGLTSWIDFAVHGALSLPGAVTTLAGTGNRQHLDQLLRSAESFKPLDSSLIENLLSCHHRKNAEPGMESG